MTTTDTETGQLFPLKIAELYALPEIKLVPRTGPNPVRGNIPQGERLYHISGKRPDLSVTQLITKYMPRVIHDSHNARSRWSLRCPLCTEYVEAEHRSFTIASDDNLWKCFACQKHGNAYQLHIALAPEEFTATPRAHTKTLPEEPPGYGPPDSLWEGDDEDVQSYEPYTPYTRPHPTHDFAPHKLFKKAAALGHEWDMAPGAGALAARMRRCGIWRRPSLLVCGKTIGYRDRCHIFGCPDCRWTNNWRKFKSIETLLPSITHPVVYQVSDVYTTPMPSIPEDVTGMTAIFRQGVTEVRKLITTWGNRKKLKVDMAQNSVYGITAQTDGVTASFGVVFFGGYEAGTKESIAHCFGKAGQHAITVKESHCTWPEEAVELFATIMATPFKWDFNEPYQFVAWKKAISGKHARHLIHGKGKFYAVNRNDKQGPPDEEFCPWHGMEAAGTKLKLVAPPPAWTPFESKINGKTYYELNIPLEDMLPMEAADDGPWDGTEFQ